MAYLPDSNVFITARRVHYGFDFCPGLGTGLANTSGPARSTASSGFTFCRMSCGSYGSAGMEPTAEVAFERKRDGMRGREIPMPDERLEEFCRRWKISELGRFGSALRADFRPDSDLDVLVSFVREADWSLPDDVAVEEELSGILGRKADLVSRRAIERSLNWIRRGAIWESAEPCFVAR